MKVKIKDTFIGENSERLNNVEIFLFFQTILILQNQFDFLNFKYLLIMLVVYNNKQKLEKETINSI